jgi:hypothetical protein
MVHRPQPRSWSNDRNSDHGPPDERLQYLHAGERVCRRHGSSACGLSPRALILVESRPYTTALEIMAPQIAASALLCGDVASYSTLRDASSPGWCEFRRSRPRAEHRLHPVCPDLVSSTLILRLPSANVPQHGYRQRGKHVPRSGAAIWDGQTRYL